MYAIIESWNDGTNSVEAHTRKTKSQAIRKAMKIISDLLFEGKPKNIAEESMLALANMNLIAKGRFSDGQPDGFDITVCRVKTTVSTGKSRT